MRFFKFLVLLALTIGLTWILDNPHTIEEKKIPAIMPLANPITGFWANAEPVKIENSETIDFPELKEPVKVVWDNRMVPHIFAQNLNDALFVQGYVTAKNRMWQMDMTSRSAAGRLSEVIGERTLEIDKLRRRQGIPWAAENAVRGWSGKSSKTDENGESDAETVADFQYLESYSSGVNAYINTLTKKDKPLEYKLLGYDVEKWSVLKSALVVKSMALSLCARSSDIAATNTFNALGEETYNFLFPDWNPRQSPIIPKGTNFNMEDSEKNVVNPTLKRGSVQTKMSAIPHRQFEQPDEFLGSNNWAISGSKSSTGNPILAGDPHLRLTLPSIWFEVQIHTPEFNAYGVAVPGIPGILIGFNEHIAWSETNVGHDVMDWYQMDWVEVGKSYLFDEIETPTTVRYEEIYVKGKNNPILDTVVYTHFGPIVHSDKDHPKHDLAMRWVAHDEPDVFEFKAFIDLIKAKNYDEYISALNPYISPAQNFVFASKEGDVAISVNGRFPIKKKGQGKFVLSGNTSDNEWKGFVPKSEVPKIKNPARGFVASANQHSTDPTYPYYYNGGFEDYRGRYLNRKLAKMDNITTNDMMLLQTDNYSLKAEEALPIMISNIDTTSLTTLEKGLLKVLRAWNYKFDAEKVAPVLFDTWWKEFYQLAWDEMHSQNEKNDFLIPEEWRTIELMDQNPNSSWWNIQTTNESETLSDLINITFKKMSKELGEKALENDFNYTRHKDFFVNHIANLAPFNRTKLQIGGTGSALNANKPGVGPSWRMVVELGEKVKAYGVYPGGQSGNPMSPYFDSNLDNWVEGEYFELNFMENEEDLEGVLTTTTFQ